MRKIILTLTILLFSISAYAQCVPETWCDAPWPPLEGQDRTVGKDSCGSTCIKIATTLGEPEPLEELSPEYLVFIYIDRDKDIPVDLQNYLNINIERPYVWYLTQVPADEVKITSGYFIFLSKGKEVGRFKKEWIVGWRKIKN